MSNTKKNLGHVTAYAYYKAGGGTMTEEEFTEYMADFGDAAERAVDAASEAAQSKADAQTAATSATNSAAAALTSEENANGAMMSAYSDANRADTAADTATSAKNDAVSAKTAAQSAKTAAETAASTATTKATAAANSATAAAGSATAAANSATNAAASAQSVASSAAQITQNAEDIDALKEDLSDDKAEITRKMQRVESYNVFATSNIRESYYYALNGGSAESSFYNCTKDIIPVSEGDVIRFYYRAELNACRYITAYNAAGTAVTAKGGDSVSTYTVPEGITGIRVSYYKNSGIAPMITINHEATAYQEHFEPYYISTDAFNPDFAAIKVIRSNNVIDKTELLPETLLNENGTTSSNSSYATTGYIDVKPGDVLKATFRSALALTIRRIVAFDGTRVITSAAAENVTSYTVPNGVNRLRFTANNSYMLDCELRASLDDENHRFEPYYKSGIVETIQKNAENISGLTLFPLTTMQSYIVKSLCYRPLGQLSKGYVCLVSDDGDADVATYTIPMVIDKGVPLTIAAMKASECWDNGTAQATVIDAIKNHGCELAQHGGMSWLRYDEYALNCFYDDEKEFWDTLGLTPYGAVCPQHDINDNIRVIAGGRFGCVRSGYISLYNNFNNGTRSNLFGLSSQSSLDGGIATQKEALDAALANKQLRIIHWHENELTAEYKEILEGLIDYALTIGLEFITMKDIPYIT